MRLAVLPMSSLVVNDSPPPTFLPICNWKRSTVNVLSSLSSERREFLTIVRSIEVVEIRAVEHAAERNVVESGDRLLDIGQAIFDRLGRLLRGIVGEQRGNREQQSREANPSVAVISLFLLFFEAFNWQLFEASFRHRSRTRTARGGDVGESRSPRSPSCSPRRDSPRARSFGFGGRNALPPAHLLRTRAQTVPMRFVRSHGRSC
jgi:hypothetical protein